MKTMNYIKIGIASSILSIAAGCTSFLEEDLKSSLAPDNTYTSSLGFEVGATGLYAIARSEYNTWGENGAFMHNGACAYEVLQISTDLCRMGTVRDGSLVPFAEMTLNPSTLFVGSYWNWAYNLIASANELLIYSEKNDNWDYPTDKQLYQAEARFFRAYAYRTLVYLYGDVPWVETIQKPFLLSFSRDPKIEVLGNIIKDLEFAKTYLPDNPDNVKEGKLTTWAARHLLSEMYLLRGAEGDYKLAEENAQDVIDCPYYSLMKSRFGNAKNDPGDYFSDMFVENNQNRSAGNTEGIWVMQFQYNTVGGGTNSDDWTRRAWNPQYHAIDGFALADSLGGRGLAQIYPLKWWIGVKGTNATTAGEKEGFCWNNLLNPNARLLKVKLKGESVNDVGSMSLYAIDLLSNKFIVALLNSNVLFDYYREFINCSVNIQVNDIKQLPIIIPTKEFAFLIESLADKAIKKKQKLVDNDLEFIEEEIEDLIKTLYSI